MTSRILPVGKLPADLLRNLLQQIQSEDPDMLLGPGIGLDCGYVALLIIGWLQSRLKRFFGGTVGKVNC